ncbi:hypothetical protein PR202_gb25887 [Eleusine coracana subsp. coracana]|uniref:Ubiquitin-like protease family profile domain-containing protein n=1 Tax=Eleusine coracana subsp. coracana TaxID=191504 RepID=A0AAV5FQ61_ELECO|nr:hypothetical protein PR202_gb25887 [Eleusine coracana subsp. coracana]
MLRRVQYVPERTTKLIFASSQDAMVLSVGREPCVPITDSQILSAAASQPITQESDEEELPQSPRSPSSPIPRRRKALASRKKRQRDADPVTDRPTKRQQPSRRGGILSTGPTTQSADLDQESDDECDKGKANVRCIPKKVYETIQKLSRHQRTELEKLGWKDFLKFRTDALECRELLVWLMNRIDAEAMCIPLDDGKKIYMKPIHLKTAFGLPSGGVELKQYSARKQSQELSNMRNLLHVSSNVTVERCLAEIADKRNDELSLRCFFMIISARLLFCRPKFHIGMEDICFSLDYQTLGQSDICGAVFRQLQNSIRDWQRSISTNKSLSGCSLFLMIKKTSDTPYFVESEEEHERDDDAFGDDVGLSEGDRDAGAAGVDVGGAGIDLPRLRQMLEPKLRSLHPSVQAEVQAELQKYDDDISRETAKIAAAHRAIKKKQIELVDKTKLGSFWSSTPNLPCPLSHPTLTLEVEESDESCTGGHTDQVQHDTRKDDNTLVHTEEVVQGDQVLNDTPLEADKIDDNCRVVSLDTSTMNPIAHLSDNVTLELETFERGVVPRKKRSEKVFVPDCDNAHHDSEKDQGDERFVNNLFNFDDAGNVPTEHSLEDVACDRQAHEITIGQVSCGYSALSNIIHFEKDGYKTELDTCTSKAGPNIISSNLGRTMDDNIGSLDLPGMCQCGELWIPAQSRCCFLSEESLDTAFDLYMTNDIAWRSIKLILIPVIDRGHYSLYAVNFEASRVDVLDTLDYDNAGTTWLYRHGESGATVITRLNALLQKKSKGALKKFGNFRLTKFSCPTMVRPNDCTFLTMKYAEHYTGVPGCVDDVVNPEKSAELRAEYLYYLLFHPSNKAEIPEDLSPVHSSHVVSSEATKGMETPSSRVRFAAMVSNQAPDSPEYYTVPCSAPDLSPRVSPPPTTAAPGLTRQVPYQFIKFLAIQGADVKSIFKGSIPKNSWDYEALWSLSNDLRLSGSDGTTHSLRTTELLTEAMGVVHAAAMSSVGRDRAMDVLRELRKQLEALPPDLGPQAAPRPNVHTSFAEPHFEPQQPLSPSRHPCAGVDSYTQDVTNQEASSIIPAQPYSIPVLISSQAPPRSRNKGGSVPIGVEVQIGAQGPKKCTRHCLKCGLKAGHNSATCPNDPKNTEHYDRAKNPVKRKRGRPADSGAMKFTRSNSRITRSTVVTKTQDDAEGHDVSGQEDNFYSSDE